LKIGMQYVDLLKSLRGASDIYIDWSSSISLA